MPSPSPEPPGTEPDREVQPGQEPSGTEPDQEEDVWPDDDMERAESVASFRTVGSEREDSGRAGEADARSETHDRTTAMCSLYTAIMESH